MKVMCLEKELNLEDERLNEQVSPIQMILDKFEELDREFNNNVET
eukprot:CAMPEP_0170567114 /NCGR_PEP_ID=MMETSP0211-20121228/80276_1 /TAXON_ID=311385 /ORGANISM="Pseudokeronopsis sp., Strain OXSARD2" /LENGTH=44 /DNA_ID= /DNA_START= /DNA_END= /DNA_ORIENTATION=